MPESDHNVEILIVEDSPTQARRLQHILSRQGYSVRHAPDGRAALASVREHKPHMIISDVVMPGMDGYELCAAIKNDAELNDIPVILVTTLSDPGDVIRGLQARADNFIVKPYDERYLVSRVQFVLLNRQMRNAEQGGLAVEIYFSGQRHVITADRLQILNLLLSTYDAAIQRNRELTTIQAQLVESESRVRLIIDTAHDAFVGIDEDSAILEWNSAAERIFGWSRSEVIGRPLDEMIIPPQYRGAHRAGIRRLLETGNGSMLNRRVELTALRRNGEEFPTELTVWAIQTNGRHTFHAFVRDITAQKEHEAALRRAMEQTERANRAKSEFISRMSHDLRTPLNAILGFAQLLEMDPLTSEQRDSVRHISNGGAHLLGLINEILDVARIESGHLTLSPEPVDVGEIVHTVVDLIRPLAAARRISLEVDTASMAGCQVTADRQRLSQILMNLVSNAVKYNREAGAVTVRCEPRPERRVRIRVSDTGPGIPPHYLDRLFQPFERLGAEQTTIEGTGLGLTLSKALAEAMGGTLDVETAIDRGSTFSVYLPGAAARTAGPRLAPAVRGVAHENTNASGTVLYIEDNLSNRRLMERLLTRRPGIRLLQSAEGEGGLELAARQRPDLILLDLHLPDITGEEVLRRLWENPDTRAIPVAVLSADATPAQEQRLRAAGAIAYLTKPLDIVQVLALLDGRLSTQS